jgi:cyclopropane-fatty-acyl-phospholipid synthase
MNRQKHSRAARVAEQHYDLGNDLYKAMLDSRMNYTCAYWKNAENLDQAQENKLDLVCRKINLRAGMRVLDLGCGWGSFAKYAAEKYGANVVAVNVSQEQVRLARELCRGLPVDVRLQDYRDAGVHTMPSFRSAFLSMWDIKITAPTWRLLTAA